MVADVDELMEQASQALVRMDYLACEAGCESALAQAFADHQWATYARILLPLQEARRQRRLIALAAGIFQVEDSSDQAVDAKAAALVWTGSDREAVRQAVASAREDGRMVMVLWTPGGGDGPGRGWEAATYDGPDVGISIETPPSSFDEAWFMAAHEALGDAAIAAVPHPIGTVERVNDLQSMLGAITDHEKLHQALAEAALAAARS